MASFLCPMIIYYNHRFDPMRYLNTWTMPFFSFTLFQMYMCFVLTPISAITWANLNHTLCGDHNDPFYSGFDLGKSYYFWAQFYLGIPSIIAQILNGYLGKIIIGAHN